MSETKLVDFESARISQIKRANANDTANALSAKGFVMIHRKIKQTSFYKDSEATHLFIHLLMDATYKPSVITINGKEIALNRGQLVTGRNELSYETGISVDRIKYLLSKLKKHGVITVDANRHYSIVSIVNYDSYQWSENGQNSAEKVPSKFHQSANSNQEPAKLSGEVVPSECHQSATINKLINNNLSNTNVLDRSFNNDSQQQSESSKSDESKKPQLRCEDVLKIFNQVLPEISAKGLSDKRRQKIRTFWQKAKKIKNDLENTKGQPFTLNDWQSYLEYISERCRWMLTDGYNQATGNKWRKKSIDYILSEQLYLEVREGVRDDK
ncbi:hypothetical protein [Thorsellia anophelis]|uniref:Phage replication protein O n=1 Tax=Thorsellia anophelis DSM 18579 TaxID=1123402 RepID=A0A1I0DBC6_9GAMM|nr:hypothetical protein [Thorsellia anophelis]SET28875.1 hypothetical protein SAMN02583745_01911 [Thorsellia anophelis DSM 18579]